MTKSQIYYELDDICEHLSFAYEKLSASEFHQAVADTINGLDSLLGRMEKQLFTESKGPR